MREVIFLYIAMVCLQCSIFWAWVYYERRNSKILQDRLR
jgi:hypothetical protein